MHEPLWQVSVCVHALPSLQALPSGFAGFEQTPVAGLQVPARWHWSGAGQVTGFVPVHVPLWQVSDCVQAFLSSQVVPFGFGTAEQAPDCVLQVPVLH